MIAFFYAHLIFTWQPKGGGGGVKPSKPAPISPPPSCNIFGDLPLNIDLLVELQYLLVF